MELETLISTAKEKLGTTNASDRTIENFFNDPLFRPAEGTEPDDAYWERTIATLKWYSENYSGQHNHDMSTARSAWEEEWKKNHPEPQTPPATPPVTPPATPPADKTQQLTIEAMNKAIAEAIAEAMKANKSTESDPVVAALQKQVDEMIKARETEANERTVNGLYDSVQKKIMDESYGEANQVILEDVIERLRLENRITKDTKLEDAEKLIRERYEAQYKRYNPGGSAPYGIAARGGSGDKSFAQKWREEKQGIAKSREEIAKQQQSRFR